MSYNGGIYRGDLYDLEFRVYGLGISRDWSSGSNSLKKVIW